VVVAIDEYLQHRKSSFRVPILAVAIGIYLPFELSVPIFAGGIINYLVKSYQSKKKLSSANAEDGPDVLASMNSPLGPWPGIFLLIGIGYWLYRISTAKADSE